MNQSSVSRTDETGVSNYLGATSIDKIGEVRLSDEIGGEGFETLKKMNFIITIRYEIPTFSSVGPFFEDGGEGVQKMSARS